jgi:ABC-type Fe3+-hydroxamate transport system substrate-binding protein
VVFAVGAGGQLVGRDTKSVYPAEALAVTDVGGTYGASINKEAIIATSPDLIIAWKYATTASAITTLEADGYKVVALSPSSIDTVKLEIQDIGVITGHKVEAQKIVQNMTERINRVIENVPVIPDSQRPKVYFELRNGNTVNNTTMSGEIIRLAGGLNIYGNATKTNPIPSSEVTISRLPAFIVIEDQSIVTNADIEARSGWSIIPAVQQHQIYRINGEWMTATPRLVNAIEQMLQWFYPS